MYVRIPWQMESGFFTEQSFVCKHFISSKFWKQVAAQHVANLFTLDSYMWQKLLRILKFKCPLAIV
jgi:hypothetical protein